MQDTSVAEAPRTANRQDVNRQNDSSQSDASRSATAKRDLQAMTPRVDVLEDDSGITLLADMPGVSKDALEIKVENNALSIEGAITAATPQALEATYAEVRVPRYRRSFTLSRELDGSRIDAQLRDGVLKLRIPKHEQARPQRISVKVS
ncbi:MAG TPA: Hsp20/alpha crystallin family protein [Burkholderiaceae bacterium]|jgi:HSP20 family molecular chaperone IbpA|nr:Hsp20/alpha crystallin family protein [Burkholderiaceae bacterium]